MTPFETSPPAPCPSAAYVGLAMCEKHRLPFDTIVRCTRSVHGDDGHFGTLAIEAAHEDGTPSVGLIRLTWNHTPDEEPA